MGLKKVVIAYIIFIYLGPHCDGLRDGFYYKDTECTSYFKCSSGVYTEYRCPSGQYFNTAIDDCQSTKPETCSGKFLSFIVVKNFYSAKYQFEFKPENISGYHITI